MTHLLKNISMAAILIAFLNSSLALAFVQLPNESDVIDAEDYYSQCSNTNAAKLCEQATTEFVSKQDKIEEAATPSDEIVSMN